RPPPNPVSPPHPPAVARKPVMFMYSRQPLDVRVEVSFLQGEPWLYYPNASVGQSHQGPGYGTLRFEGELAAGSGTLAPVSPQHFWADLRAVGGHTFTSHDGSRERFLFYDGPVQFERSMIISRQGGGAVITATSSERMVWLVQSGRYTESELSPHAGTAQLAGEGDMTMLRARLDAELQARGLSAREARSLLETWRDDLFRSGEARAIYFIPRDAYDRMLPVRIDPIPEELVRVGLVIETLR
ncbi:MAG: hypothetical protein AAGF12_38960, partial [Myxococcota bacterium]